MSDETPETTGSTTPPPPANTPAPAPVPPQAPPPAPASGEAMFWGMKRDKFCMFMYFALFANVIIALAGVVLPIVMWVTNKEKDASGAINWHGRNILNLMISVFIYSAVASLLIFAIIGFILLPLVGVFGLVVTIMAGLKAGEGKYWPVPYCIRFFKDPPPAA